MQLDAEGSQLILIFSETYFLAPIFINLVKEYLENTRHHDSHFITSSPLPVGVNLLSIGFLMQQRDGELAGI